jgi:hypothetical protein
LRPFVNALHHLEECGVALPTPLWKLSFHRLVMPHTLPKNRESHLSFGVYGTHINLFTMFVYRDPHTCFSFNFGPLTLNCLNLAQF